MERLQVGKQPGGGERDTGEKRVYGLMKGGHKSPVGKDLDSAAGNGIEPKPTSGGVKKGG